ncbi:MAG TPA: XRE family transcriptional regulator [Ruminococcaceae bacterium]|nr:XRE family transcriptional regulator [Oscillospiraceae bacterium]
MYWKEHSVMAIRILLSTKLGELRWSQADLARKTGIRPTTINEMYHEVCERVNLEHLDLICEALDCDLTDILKRVPSPLPTITNNRAGNLKKKTE